jgi:hypothetical protein
MSKNKTKKKLSSFKIFCLSSLALLILIIGSTFLYTLSLEIGRNSNDITTRISEFVGGLRMNRFVKDQSVKDTLTYTLPSGWTEEEDSTTNTVVTLKSGDYNRDLMQGVEIAFSVAPKDLFMTLEEIKREIKKADNYFADIQIDNIPGIRSVTIKDRYEGYSFIKGKYLIQISILILPQNISTDMQDKYWSDINSIINSIQFK